MANTVYESTDIVCLTEPRIELIARQLESLLQVVELEYNGQAVQVDGFRLRNPSDWLATGPDLSLSNLGSLSGACNCACEFCYELGQPPDAPIKSQARRRPLSVEEARTRLNHYDLETEIGLFRTLSRYTEAFTNPNLLRILELVRARVPNEYFSLTTNGGFLREATIQQLATLKPIVIRLSLNSANSTIRQRIMRDPHPTVAIEAVPLMRQYGIQFCGTIIAWPTVPLEDIINTIHYLDAHDALSIMVNLPGYTRYHPVSEMYDFEFWWRWWEKVLEATQDTCHTVTAPLFVSPYSYDDAGLTPRVLGVFKNSPAARTGIQPGDILLEINGARVVSRSHARDLLFKASQEQNGPCPVHLLRNGQEIQHTVAPIPLDGRDYYPYLPSGYPPPTQVQAMEVNMGLLVADSLRLMYIDELYRIIQEREAKRVLFLSSHFLRPVLLRLLAQRGLPPGVELQVEVPGNVFFGGNIIVGDLLTVDEFVVCIEQVVREKGFQPDLVVIPSSPFSQWKRDLTGKVWLEIERRTGIPLALLRNRRISP